MAPQTQFFVKRDIMLAELIDKLIKANIEYALVSSSPYNLRRYSKLNKKIKDLKKAINSLDKGDK